MIGWTIKRLPLLGALLLLLSLPLRAEQFVDQGEYRVHYSAINSTLLTPEVARRFNVTRTRGQALLVLNAQKRDGEGRYQPVAAVAEGRARSLIGHVEKLKLRPVREGDVHYVMAAFQILDAEFLTLELTVRPDGTSARIPLKFQQQFYRD